MEVFLAMFKCKFRITYPKKLKIDGDLPNRSSVEKALKKQAIGLRVFLGMFQMRA